MAVTAVFVADALMPRFGKCEATARTNRARGSLKVATNRIQGGEYIIEFRLQGMSSDRNGDNGLTLMELGK